VGLTARIVGARMSPPSDTLAPADGFAGVLGATGEVITVEKSLRLDTVYSAVRLVSETTGSLPLKVYERVPRGGRIEAWEDPRHRLLGLQPNPEHTAISLWALEQVHLLTWGNAYLGKQFGRRGEVVALWPMLPERMRVSRKKGRKVYQYREIDGSEKTYGPETVLHFHGLSLDGLTGVSPIGFARAVIAAGLAHLDFEGAFYRNSAVPRGVIEIAGEIGEEAMARLEKTWAEAHRGRKNMHKVAILEGGAKFNPISMPLEDAQFVEQSGLSTKRIARIFGIPPEKLAGDSGESLTYSTVESQNLAFMQDGVRPWLVRFEQGLAVDPDLFPEPRFYPEFLVDAMLRADQKTRAETNALALDPVKGWKTRAEVRSQENLPPEDEPPPVRVSREPGAVQDDMARILGEMQKARESDTSNGGARHAHV